MWIQVLKLKVIDMCSYLNLQTLDLFLLLETNYVFNGEVNLQPEVVKIIEVGV